MARIDKTQCDVCSAEHATVDKKRSPHTRGEWIEIHIAVLWGDEKDYGFEARMEVCWRMSCISAGYARLYEQVGKKTADDHQKRIRGDL